MFKLQRFEIEGFWGRFRAESDVDEDIAIFVGKNGSGKTTLIDILNAALTVDLRLLLQLEFSSILLRLKSGRKQRTIRVEKEDNPDLPFERVLFRVSNRPFELPLYSREIDADRYIRRRPRVSGEYESLRSSIDEIVNVTTVTVHRDPRNWDHSDDDYPHRRPTRKLPIDRRLDELTARLTRYQLGLTEDADRVADEFLRRVLVSILYDPQFDQFGDPGDYAQDLGEKEADLMRAYGELQALDEATRERIETHVERLGRSAEHIRAYMDNPDLGLEVDHVMPLPLFKRTKHITELSLEAEKAKAEIFFPIRRYLSVITEFIDDKTLRLSTQGELEFEANGRIFSAEQLSSGEKQLLVFLTETLLQKSAPYIFIADEPELSLHVEWQEKVVGSIRALNPKAQIILATHSPEIIGDRVDKVIDMEKVIK